MRKNDPQLEKLGEILSKSLKRLELSSKLEEYRIWPVWDEIVGTAIARNAQPEKIRNGTLFVKVSSSTWMQELQYMKEMISERLNGSLGRQVVKNIFFFVGKIDPVKLHPGDQKSLKTSPRPTGAKLDDGQLGAIKDPEIRRALRRLYAAHSQKGKK